MSELISRFRRKLNRELGTLKRSARKRIAKTVYALPPFAGHDPRRRITKFKEYCHPVRHFPNESVHASQGWYLPIRPPEILHRKPAFALNEVEAAKFEAAAMRYQYGSRFEIPEVFLACVNGARVHGSDFLVLSPDNQIFFESLLSRNDLLEANGILEALFWPTATRRYDSACLLAQNSPHAYYHWLIEVLPKLSLIEPFVALSSTPLLLPEELKPFQRESLQLAGVTSGRRLSFEGGCAQFDRLFFPPVLSPTGCPSPHAVAWLRERFLKHAVPRSGASKKIYVTRRDSAQRRVCNEDEIIACLRAQGFEIVCAGDLTFAEQISVFRDVEVVVAAHGAGVTNMVFAPPDATLIELFGDNYINGCFWALANICGHKYGFVTGPSQYWDYTIRADDLRTMLWKILNA